MFVAENGDTIVDVPHTPSIAIAITSGATPMISGRHHLAYQYRKDNRM